MLFSAVYRIDASIMVLIQLRSAKRLVSKIRRFCSSNSSTIWNATLITWCRVYDCLFLHLTLVQGAFNTFREAALRSGTEALFSGVSRAAFGRLIPVGTGGKFKIMCDLDRISPVTGDYRRKYEISLKKEAVNQSKKRESENMVFRTEGVGGHGTESGQNGREGNGAEGNAWEETPWKEAERGEDDWEERDDEQNGRRETEREGNDQGGIGSGDNGWSGNEWDDNLEGKGDARWEEQACKEPGWGGSGWREERWGEEGWEDDGWAQTERGGTGWGRIGGGNTEEADNGLGPDVWGEKLCEPTGWGNVHSTWGRFERAASPLEESVLPPVPPVPTVNSVLPAVAHTANGQQSRKQLQPVGFNMREMDFIRERMVREDEESLGHFEGKKAGQRADCSSGENLETGRNAWEDLDGPWCGTQVQRPLPTCGFAGDFVLFTGTGSEERQRSRGGADTETPLTDLLGRRVSTCNDGGSMFARKVGEKDSGQCLNPTVEGEDSGQDNWGLAELVEEWDGGIAKRGGGAGNCPPARCASDGKEDVEKKGDQEGQEHRNEVAINNEISKGLESKENGRNLLADSALGKRKEAGILGGAGDFEEQLHFWSARPHWAAAREGHVTDSTEPDSVPLEKENLVTETSLDAREGPVVNTGGRALVAAREDGRESDNKGGPKSDLERRKIYGRQVQIQEIRERAQMLLHNK